MNYIDIIKEEVEEHLDERNISGILLEMLEDDDLNILCGEIKHMVDRLAHKYVKDDSGDVDMADDDSADIFDVDEVGLEISCIDLAEEIAEAFHSNAGSFEYAISYMKYAFEKKCGIKISQKHLEEIVSTSVDNYNKSCSPHRKKYSEDFGDLHGWYWEDCTAYDCECFEHTNNIKTLLEKYIIEKNY